MIESRKQRWHDGPAAIALVAYCYGLGVLLLALNV
jgi:hypothetical protein